MPRLNQIIAIEDGTKKKEYADLTKQHQILQKSELFNGFLYSYTPNDSEGQVYPDEKKIVQSNAKEIVNFVKIQLSEFFDIVATKDTGNTQAKADIVVDGVIIAAQVPVTYMLFLEKQLNDLRVFITKLPVLDPSKSWKFDDAKDMYVTDSPDHRLKTRKVHKSLVKIPPGPHTKGEADIITVDEVEGSWTQLHMSTAYPASQIREMLEKVHKLQSAVKCAREEANSILIDKVKVGDSILGYIFG